jgi:hypothetical protein
LLRPETVGATATIANGAIIAIGVTTVATGAVIDGTVAIGAIAAGAIRGATGGNVVTGAIATGVMPAAATSVAPNGIMVTRSASATGGIELRRPTTAQPLPKYVVN